MPDEEAPPAGGADTPAPEVTGTPPVTTGQADVSPQEGDVDQLPSWARAALTKANNEAAAARVKAKELEPLAQKAKELEDAGRSELDKATEKLTAAERRAQDAEARAMRLEVAAVKGLTSAQAKRLVGSTVEELEADADELLSTFKPQEGEKKTPPGQPTERLSGGIDPTETPSEVDPRKIAAQIPRY